MGEGLWSLRRRPQPILVAPFLLDTDNDESSYRSKDKESKNGHDPVEISPPACALVSRIINRARVLLKLLRLFDNAKLGGTVVLFRHLKHGLGGQWNERGCHPS
jgi:hypothetical protein